MEDKAQIRKQIEKILDYELFNPCFKFMEANGLDRLFIKAHSIPSDETEITLLREDLARCLGNFEEAYILERSGEPGTLSHHKGVTKEFALKLSEKIKNYEERLENKKLKEEETRTANLRYWFTAASPYVILIITSTISYYFNNKSEEEVKKLSTRITTLEAQKPASANEPSQSNSPLLMPAQFLKPPAQTVQKKNPDTGQQAPLVRQSAPENP